MKIRKKLVQVKNAYLSAGLGALNALRVRLEAKEDSAEWRDEPDALEIREIRQQLRQLKGLERGFRSNFK